MGYTVISRDPNNWVHTPEGRDFHEITYACGHNHRTMEGAIRCLDSLAGTTDSLHAEIEEKHIDQM